MVLVIGTLKAVAARAAGCDPGKVLAVVDHGARIKYVRSRGNDMQQPGLAVARKQTATLAKYMKGKLHFQRVDWTGYRTRVLDHMWTILYKSIIFVKVEQVSHGYIVHFYFGDTARWLLDCARREEVSLIEQKSGQYVQLPASSQHRLSVR